MSDFTLLVILISCDMAFAYIISHQILKNKNNKANEASQIFHD